MNSSIRSVPNQIAFQGWYRRKEIAQALTRTVVRETATAVPGVVTYLITKDPTRALEIGVPVKAAIDATGIIRNVNDRPLSLLNVFSIAGRVFKGLSELNKKRWI